MGRWDVHKSRCVPFGVVPAQDCVFSSVTCGAWVADVSCLGVANLAGLLRSGRSSTPGEGHGPSLCGALDSGILRLLQSIFVQLAVRRRLGVLRVLESAKWSHVSTLHCLVSWKQLGVKPPSRDTGLMYHSSSPSPALLRKRPPLGWGSREQSIGGRFGSSISLQRNLSTRVELLCRKRGQHML